MFTVRELNWKKNTNLLTKDEALAGMNEKIRMGWRCSTELYAEILMAVM